MADSREEKIIKSMLGEQVELEPPQSRIEVLLYELKEAIERGGGGGGGVSVAPYFFEVQVTGIYSDSGQPVMNVTSISYATTKLYIRSGRQIMLHTTCAPEIAQELQMSIEEYGALTGIGQDQEGYFAQFVLGSGGQMTFSAPDNGTPLMFAGQGGGDDEDQPVLL